MICGDYQSFSTSQLREWTFSRVQSSRGVIASLHVSNDVGARLLRHSVQEILQPLRHRLPTQRVQKYLQKDRGSACCFQESYLLMPFQKHQRHKFLYQRKIPHRKDLDKHPKPQRRKDPCRATLNKCAEMLNQSGPAAEKVSHAVAL